MLLSTKNLPVSVAVGGSRKLGPLYCGPFYVLEKLTAAYILELPPYMQICEKHHQIGYSQHKQRCDKTNNGLS